jgi:hypothetical protein
MSSPRRSCFVRSYPAPSAQSAKELGARLDVGYVDGFTGSVVGSRNLNLGAGERLGFFLVVQPIDRFIGAIEQDKLAANAYAAVGAILGTLALVHHGRMSAQQGALLIHDFTRERLRLLAGLADRQKRGKKRERRDQDDDELFHGAPSLNTAAALTLSRIQLMPPIWG